MREESKLGENTMTEEHYKILNLHAENVKRLKVVDITPDEGQDVITITGRNGQGKTSVLDSIFWALAGKKHIQDEPIRKGEERAEIVIDLGPYKVTRTFTEKDSYISVENQDGFKTSSPQALLDKLMGAITFDPLDFTRQDAKTQYETLRDLVELDIDIDELDRQSKEDYDERTIVNRQAKELKAQIDGIEIPEDTPAEPVDVQALAGKVLAANNANAAVKGNAADIDRAKMEIQDLENRLKEKRRVLETLQQERDSLQKNAVAQSQIEAWEKEMADASRINATVQDAKDKAKKQAELKAKEDESARLTKAIDDRARKKAEALARAEMPITGLSFSDGKVLYKGVPFNQASNAEQIKVSTAIAIAMNPKLRVIRIKDGSLLDEDSMDTLRTMAREYNFQVWLERVQDDDPVAIVIEDGMVKGAGVKEEAA